MRRATGTVQWFDPAKGFGFVTPDEADVAPGDVFVHVRALVEGAALPVEGDRVEFGVHEGPRGPQASDVRVLRD